MRGEWRILPFHAVPARLRALAAFKAGLTGPVVDVYPGGLNRVSLWGPSETLLPNLRAALYIAEIEASEEALEKYN